jgi:ferredoxin
MSTTLFYFTGTGNCLKVARDLAKELGDTNIVSIPSVINKEIDCTCDSIGVIYPVYMFGMPLIVSKFINKLNSAQNKYVFAIATYGGMAADSLGQTAKELQARGLRLSAGFCVKMPGNYTPLYEAIPLDIQKEMFEKEKERIKEIAAAVKEKKQSRIEKGSFLSNLIFSGIIYNVSFSKIPFMDRGFWANDDCNSCGTCAKVCPVNNIELINGRPVWLHKCEQCFACLHWCPKEAVQYGKKTQGRKRYRNPDIKLQDLLFK